MPSTCSRAWSQEAYVKASNTESTEFFGRSAEDSNATGIGGNQANNSADVSGAVYLY